MFRVPVPVEWNVQTEVIAKHSDKYAYRIPATAHKQLLVAKVLTGVVTGTIMHTYQTVCMARYQTQIFVIYDHEKAYPAYVITYIT